MELEALFLDHVPERIRLNVSVEAGTPVPDEFVATLHSVYRMETALVEFQPVTPILVGATRAISVHRAEPARQLIMDRQHAALVVFQRVADRLDRGVANYQPR